MAGSAARTKRARSGAKARASTLPTAPCAMPWRTTPHEAMDCTGAAGDARQRPCTTHGAQAGQRRRASGRAGRRGRPRWRTPPTGPSRAGWRSAQTARAAMPASSGGSTATISTSGCRRRSPGRAGACCGVMARSPWRDWTAARREGADAEALLLEATGWRIPLDAMAAWVRGVRAAGPADGRVRRRLACRRSSCSRAGRWSIAVGPRRSGAPCRRVFARQGEASVRLVVEHWDSP